MTEPPNSGELDTAAVELTDIYLMYEVKTTDCTKLKPMLGHKICELRAESRLYRSPCI